MAHHGTELIAVLGRGIERAGEKGRWRPTRYIERFDADDGHPGVRVPDITMDSPDNRVVIGGANASVIAAGELVGRLWLEGESPKMLAFVCGRPSYLSAEPEEVTGAKINKARFERRFGNPPGLEIVACGDKNKNTKDDILTIMNLARANGFRKIAILTVAVHIPRSQEFLKLIRREHHEFRGIGVGFFASEYVLARRHPLYRKALFKALHSKAYEHTWERERRGIKLLREGNYTSLQDKK